uniref:Uncharacterized protein n=1 Tax=Romanomermis culicivorax TaxID=13658 RepID=A0A915JT88_ROMCU
MKYEQSHRIERRIDRSFCNGSVSIKRPLRKIGDEGLRYRLVQCAVYLLPTALMLMAAENVA